MNGAEVVAEILKREGTEFLSCYPRNPLIEAGAALDIRPILCRQERVGVGIADGYTRIKRGKRNGVFAAQAGPGIENAFAGVAQAFTENVPLLVLPAGLPLERQYVHPVFRAADVYRPVTKWSALAHSGAGIAGPDAPRLSGHAQRQGRPGDGRNTRRGIFRRIPGHARLHTGAAAAQRARPGRDREGRRNAAGRQAPGAVGRPGRTLCRSRRTARGACRADSGAGGRHQPRQKRHRRQPSAGAWLVDAVALQNVRRIHETRRPGDRHRLEPDPHPVRARRAARQDASSTRPTTPPTSTRNTAPTMQWSATPPW